MRARKRALVLTLIAVISFIAYLIWSNPFSAFAEVGYFRFDIYALGAVIDQIGLLFFATSWYLILRAMSIDISLWGATQLTFVSLFIGWLAPLPLMTEMVRAYLVKDKTGSNLGKAISSVLIHRAYYNVAFGIIIGVTLILSLVNGSNTMVNTEVIYFLAIFALASIAFFWLILSKSALHKIYKISPLWLKRNFFDRYHDPESGRMGFAPVIDDIGTAVATLKSKLFVNFIAFLMLAFHWSASAFTAYFSALALGIRLDPVTTIFAFSIVEFLQQLNFFIPSGLGILDAGLTGALVIAGLPLNQAAAVSLLTRISTYWMEILICAPVALRFGYREFLRKYFEGEKSK